MTDISKESLAGVLDPAVMSDNSSCAGLWTCLRSWGTGDTLCGKIKMRGRDMKLLLTLVKITYRSKRSDGRYMVVSMYRQVPCQLLHLRLQRDAIQTHVSRNIQYITVTNSPDVSRCRLHSARRVLKRWMSCVIRMRGSVAESYPEMIVRMISDKAVNVYDK